MQYLYKCFSFHTALDGIILERSSKSVIRLRPHGSLHVVYEGTPWSLPRWMFIAARSIPKSKDGVWNKWLVSSSVMNSSRFWMGWFTMPSSKRSTAPMLQMLDGFVTSMWRDTSANYSFVWEISGVLKTGDLGLSLNVAFIKRWKGGKCVYVNYKQSLNFKLRCRYLL